MFWRKADRIVQLESHLEMYNRRVEWFWGELRRLELENARLRDKARLP